MVQLMMSSLSQLMLKGLKNKRLVIEAVICVLLAFSCACGTTLYKRNKSLSESLNRANNNIEAYQGIISDAQQANNVLQLDIDQLKNSNDELLKQLNSTANKNNIKSKDIITAATQTQELNVSSIKSTEGMVYVKNDTIYTDSILYNNLTKIYYSIGNDSIDIKLDIKNTQYLYTFKTKDYKNKKSFIKRLLTLDFKKVEKHKYKIVNTNELFKESDIRIIER